MSETEKSKFVKPKLASSEDQVPPIVWEIELKKFKVYVDKVGYSWEMAGQSGLAERVRVQLAKLDDNGDIVGNKKQLNIPSAISEKQLKELFNMILAVKDKPLV